MLDQVSEQHQPTIFATLLESNNVACLVDADKQKRVLQTLAGLLKSQTDVASSQNIMEALVAREKLGSCNLGRGIALPHARLNNISVPALALMTLKQPISYDNFNKQAVDIVCGLIIPEKDADLHLDLLAQLAELLQNEDFCQRLRLAQDNQQLLSAAYT